MPDSGTRVSRARRFRVLSAAIPIITQSLTLARRSRCSTSMSLSAALLGLADDLNTHLGAQHDLGKLRQQHEHKLVQHQQQRQHKQVQQQQQRKRYREEQEQQQRLQYNKPATTLPSPTATTRVQLRGAWSSTETALLHSLIRSTARRHQGYSTDSDDDSSDTELKPTAGHGAELQFDDYCAIARRMRRPVQEVMTLSAPINSPLAAFLRSSASEVAAPDGVAQYTEFIAQQFDRSLGQEADRQWARETEQRRHDKQIGTEHSRRKEEEEEDDAQVEQEGEEEGGEDEAEETGEAEQASRANGMESDDADSEQSVRAVRKSPALEDDYSDDSDSDASYRDGDEQDEHDDEDDEDASDDSSEQSDTDNEDSEDGSEDTSVIEASSESDEPLSARMKQAAKQMRRR